MFFERQKNFSRENYFLHYFETIEIQIYAGDSYKNIIILNVKILDMYVCMFLRLE